MRRYGGLACEDVQHPSPLCSPEEAFLPQGPRSHLCLPRWSWGQEGSLLLGAQPASPRWELSGLGLAAVLPLHL